MRNVRLSDQSAHSLWLSPCRVFGDEALFIRNWSERFMPAIIATSSELFSGS